MKTKKDKVANSNPSKVDPNNGDACAGSPNLYWAKSHLAWIASLKETCGTKLDKPVDPAVESLCKKLLSIGGEKVSIFFSVVPSMCGNLANHGVVMTDDGKQKLCDACQKNTKWPLFWRENKAKFRLMTGYALYSDDQTWHQFTWLVAESGELLATTTEAKTYYGVELSGLSAEIFSHALM